MTYLTAVRGSEAGDASAFVDRAMRVLDMLGAACTAAGNYQERALVQGEGELGMGIGSGERPHAQVGDASLAQIDEAVLVTASSMTEPH